MSNTYKPERLPDARKVEDLPELILALRRDQDALKKGLESPELDLELIYRHAAPERVRKGQFVLADGADWNPGYGVGLYRRNEANTAWNPISAGSWGTVTQATSKATGATLNTTAGEITMNGAALAAGTIVSFTLTNSTIGASDVLALNHASGGTGGAYLLTAACAAGSAVIYVRNNTLGNLSEAVVIRFSLIKTITS